MHFGAEVQMRGIKNEYLIVVRLSGSIECGENICEGFCLMELCECASCSLSSGDASAPSLHPRFQ